MFKCSSHTRSARISALNGRICSWGRAVLVLFVIQLLPASDFLARSNSRPESVDRLKMPKGVSLHTLRHTHGSHLLAAGMEITAVSERLGHSSPRVTQEIYAHAIRGRDDEAAMKWEQFQRRNTPEDHSRGIN